MTWINMEAITQAPVDLAHFDIENLLNNCTLPDIESIKTMTETWFLSRPTHFKHPNDQQFTGEGKLDKTIK